MTEDETLPPSSGFSATLQRPTQDRLALKRVIKWFPATKVGNPEPHNPRTRRHYAEILREQLALAEAERVRRTEP